MKLTHRIRTALTVTVLSLFCVMSLFETTHAANLSAWDPGNIIDDATFTHSSTMLPDDIQRFLNSKVPTCDAWGTQPYAGTTRAAYASSRGVTTPFTCIKDYYENGQSAAQIIYAVSQQYQINPQVLIVLLQKEQGLILDDWPWPVQYRSATGYGCPDTAPCDDQYYGLTNQVTWSAKMFRSILNNNPDWYTPYILGNNYVQWSPNPACGGSTVNIQNKATQSLYNYTPYQPNSSVLNAGYGMGDNCGAYGNRNFWLYFTDWFGSTYAFVYGGINFDKVFNPQYYLDKYPDIKAAFGDNQILAFNHFMSNGLAEGRQGNADFNVTSYINRYYDLRRAYGNNTLRYAQHYILYGKAEGRIASGDYLGGNTIYNGINYSAVYDFDYYEKTNPDIKNYFGLNDNAALQHFVLYGTSEGRQGNADFNVTSYMNRYYDLRHVYGSNVLRYAQHYILYGKAEGRIASGDYLGGTTIYNGVNYAAVYDFDYYEKTYPDIKNKFGLNDYAALQHFVLYGMNEGRQGNADFNVTSYMNRYPDLRAVYGSNLRYYYLHYIYYGKSEGRTAL